MWIFTTYGFFSAVTDKQNPNQMAIRTRNYRHLEALMKRFHVEAEILSYRGTDYQYRIVVPKATWVRIATELAQDVDYTNFKSAAEYRVKHLGRPYVNCLHQVWETVFEVFHSRKVNVGVWDE